jgi:holo-[acyl-carrier protein] synthase
MVVAVGIDLVEIDRIQHAVEQYGARFMNKVFTEVEQQTYVPGGSCERLAARFAAKEAVMKALGTGWACGVTWLDIEVATNGGRPYILLHGEAQSVAQRLGIQRMHISLTHTQDTAAAVAVGDTGV